MPDAMIACPCFVIEFLGLMLPDFPRQTSATLATPNMGDQVLSQSFALLGETGNTLR